jgi:hypothetical protein
MVTTLTVYCIIVCKTRCVCQGPFKIDIGIIGVCYQPNCLSCWLMHNAVNGMIRFCLDFEGCRKLVFAKHVPLHALFCLFRFCHANHQKIAIFPHLTGPRIAYGAGTATIAIATQHLSLNETLPPKLSAYSLWHVLCSPQRKT